MNNVLRKTAVSIAAGETDEPVTCDIKRLIRLPGSLHGKTGFKVEKISFKNLESFNPLNHAVVISDELTYIELGQDFNIIMKDENFELKKGKQKVPMFLAVFLIGRRVANII